MLTNRSHHMSATALTVIALALCISPLARAQEAGDPPSAPAAARDETAAEAPSTDSGEIVVTALVRSSSAQEVPATIALISGEVVAKANISSGLDLSRIAPGVLIQSGPGISPVAGIRGIGTNASNQAFDQSVALFADGIFLARGKDYMASLFDVDDIQVIKGSQSAILGKNTTVGAIVMNTARPERDFGYRLSYNHDFTLGSDTVDAMLNLPLSDTFAVRLAGRYADLGGWMRNDLLNKTTADVRTRAGRISLRWRPTSELDWTVNYQHESFKSEGQVFYVGGDPFGLVRTYAASAGDPNFVAAFNDRYRASARSGLRDTYADNKSDRVISNLSYTWGDGFTLSAITGYLRSRGSYLNNNNAVANSPVIFSSDLNGSNTFSQEVRLVTPRIGAFDLILGGLYYHDIYRYNLGIDAIAPSPIVGAQNSLFKQTTEDWSGFAAVNAYLTDKLTLSGAIRYTHEERSADYARQIIRPGNLIDLIYQPFPSSTLSQGRGYLDGSGSIKYEFSPNAMVYVSYGKGSKSGGFANAPNSPLAFRPDGTRAAQFEPEVAKTFEVGAKIGLGRGSHLNASFFDIQIDKFQTSLFTGTQFVVKNIDVRSRGAELEALLRVTEALSASLNVTYADTLNKSHLPTEISSLVRAPQWNGIASINYDAPLTDQFRLSVDASALFRSSLRFQDTLASTVPESPGYAKFDLRIGLKYEPRGIEIAFVGQNLTDRRVANYGSGFFPGVAGAYLVATDPPRTFSIQLTVAR